MKSFHDSKVTLHNGDCVEVLKAVPENSIDAVVTDPPYHLTSIVKWFGGANATPAKGNEAFIRASRGFMGKVWDGGDIAFTVELWAEVLRVLKPGGHMVCFGGTRTCHRMVCAIEDAGFEIRDQLAWVYSRGFPKSHNISRNLDEVRCGCRSDRAQPEHNVHGMWEQHVPASVHAGEGDREILFQSLQEHSSSAAERKELPDYAGADEPCMEGWGNVSQEARELHLSALRAVPAASGADGEDGRIRDGASAGDGDAIGQGATTDGMRPSLGSRSAKQRSGESGTVAVQSEPQKRGAWPYCDWCGKPVIPDGLGTALKPAHEPICLARKPLSESTVAANVLRWGTGALNIDATRVGTGEIRETSTGGMAHKANPIYGRFNDERKPTATTTMLGRWPANLCHDGSPEVMAGFPESNSAPYPEHLPSGALHNGGIKTRSAGGFAESGSAARFFASFPQEENQCQSQNGHASYAESSLSLSSEHAVSVLSRAVAVSTERLALHLQSYQALDTNVSGLLFDGIETLLTETIQNIEKRFLRGLRLERLSLSDSHAKIAATPNPTGTITITISLLKSSGFVGAAMFDLIGTSLGAGASDSAKRFHYTSKADADDRLNSKHPTVKPVDLMQWLVRLVCPKGATVLDPFAGTGTTGAASFIEGRRCVLIEREAEYLADIEKRMDMLLSGSEERSWKLAKPEPLEALPLFALTGD